MLMINRIALNIGKNTACLPFGRKMLSTRTSQRFTCLKMKSYNLRAIFLLNSQRHYSSRKGPRRALQVIFVPLSGLLLSIWAFVYGGFSLKQSQDDVPRPPMPASINEEPAYVSRVERLHNERRARKYAAMQNAKTDQPE